MSDSSGIQGTESRSICVEFRTSKQNTRPALRQMFAPVDKSHDGTTHGHNNKRFEQERKRVRQLQSTTALQQQKIRQLEIEMDTMQRSLQYQLEMYKRMLGEKQNEKRKHIETLQNRFDAEVQQALNEKEEQIRALQEQKQSKIKAMQNLLNKNKQQERQIVGLKQKNKCLQSSLSESEIKLKEAKQTSEQNELNYKESLRQKQVQFDQLRQKYNEEAVKHEKEVLRLQEQKKRETEQLSKQLKEVAQKQQEKAAIMLKQKNEQLDKLVTNLESEVQRLKNLIVNKDRVNSALMNDNTREKERTCILQRQYQEKLAALQIKQKTLLRNIQTVTNQKSLYKISCQQLEAQLQILESDPSLKELAEDNAKLVLKNQQLEYAMDKLKEQTPQKDELQQLRQILFESSQELERCRKQLISLASEKQQLLQLTQYQNQEIERLKYPMQRKYEYHR